MNKSQSSLLDATRKLLLERPRKLTLKRIAADTELSVGFVHHMIVSSTDDPGVCKVQRLYEYLTDTKLNIN